MRWSLLLVALAVLAVGGQAAQPMTQKEVLDLFFKYSSVRQKIDKALALGLPLPSIGPLLSQWRAQGFGEGGQGLSGLLRAPWETPSSKAYMKRLVGDSFDSLVEQARGFIEAVAEPLKIERINLTQSSPLVNSVGEITQVAISQLSTFNILDRDLDLSTVSAKLKVDFEKLDAHGVYNVDATASEQLHVFGDGHFDIRLYRPTVEVSVQLGYGNEYFSVEELSVYVKLEKLKVVLSNFLGGGEVGDLVCGIVSDVGPAFLDMYREEVNQFISTEVKGTANALLNKMPITKIIDWIMGGGGSDDDDGDDDDDTTDN